MITRIFCSRSTKAHQIGGVSADGDGLVLTFENAVMTTADDPQAVRSPQDGYYYRTEGARERLHSAEEARIEVDLWCSACKTGHPIYTAAIFKTARSRRRAVTLTSRGAWEGIWTA